jgi:hypothetical protein
VQHSVVALRNVRTQLSHALNKTSCKRLTPSTVYCTNEQTAGAAVGGWADRYPHALGLASQRINPHSQDAAAAATASGSISTGTAATAGTTATTGATGATTTAGESLFSINGASTIGGLGHLQLPRRPLQQQQLQQGAARHRSRALGEQQQQQQLRVPRPDAFTVGDWRQSLTDKFQRDMADKVS